MNPSQATIAHPSDGYSTTPIITIVTVAITVEYVYLPVKEEAVNLLHKLSFGSTIVQKRAFIIEKVLPQRANLLRMVTNHVPDFLSDS